MATVARRRFKQHATNVSFARQLLAEDESPIDLSTGVDKVVFKMDWAYQDPELPFAAGRSARLVGVPKVENEAVVLPGQLGDVRYDWRTQDVDEPGLFLVEWHIFYASGALDIFPREFYDEVRILPELEPE